MKYVYQAQQAKKVPEIRLGLETEQNVEIIDLKFDEGQAL